MHAGIFFHTISIDRNDRNLRIPCRFQRLADKTHIIGGSAASSGLYHHDCQLIGIVFSGKNFCQNLTGYNKGRVAGVIVHIFQSQIQHILIFRTHHDQPVSGTAKRRFKKVKMRLNHTCTKDRIARILHFLRIFFPFIILKDREAGSGLTFPHFHSRHHRTDADPGCTQVIYFVNFQ